MVEYSSTYLLWGAYTEPVSGRYARLNKQVRLDLTRPSLTA